MSDPRAEQEQPLEEHWYSVTIVVEQTGVSVQRLRVLEREGLIAPRGAGRERRYSAADLARLRKIRRLTEQLGVNLAGVEVILRLTEELEALRRERADRDWRGHDYRVRNG